MIGEIIEAEMPLFSIENTTVFSHSLVTTLDYEGCLTLWRTAYRVENNLPFWQGDMILHMAELIKAEGVAMSEVYDRISRDLNLGFTSGDRVEQLAYLSRNVPVALRVYDVSPSVYKVIASVGSYAEQEKWLIYAERTRIGAASLREEIRGMSGNKIEGRPPKEVGDDLPILKRRIEELEAELEEREESERPFIDGDASMKLDALEEILSSMPIANFTGDFIKALKKRNIISADLANSMLNELESQGWL